jgi:hypothetical protein
MKKILIIISIITIYGCGDSRQNENNKNTSITGKIVGKWIDEKYKIKYTLYKINNNFTMLSEYEDGNKNTTTLIIKTIKGKKALWDKNDPNGFFHVESDGKLCLYDIKDGLLMKFKKIK